MLADPVSVRTGDAEIGAFQLKIIFIKFLKVVSPKYNTQEESFRTALSCLFHLSFLKTSDFYRMHAKI